MQRGMKIGQDTGSNHVFPVMLAFYNTDRKTVKERSIYRSRVCINSKEHEIVNGFSQAYYWALMGLGDLGRSIYFQGAGKH